MGGGSSAVESRAGARWSHVAAVLGLGAWLAGLWLVPTPGEAADSAAGAALEEAPAQGSEVAPPAERWVDPAALSVAAAPGWADPRWLERIRAVTSDVAPFATAGAAPELEELRSALAELSFVERVVGLDVSPEAGLAVELVLRRPVACIAVGSEFALVDEDGVVLEGRWPLPPRLGRAYLPVLGRLDDPLLAEARAGDWLIEPEHLDALDVALSMAAEVPEDDRAALGRVVIDARTARKASLAEPGIRLELEGGRVALYGRAPSAAEPGELASSAKWRSLVRAFDWFAEDPATHDWHLVDLRWDRPDLAPVEAVEVAHLEVARAVEPELTRARAARAPGPRVR